MLGIVWLQLLRYWLHSCVVLEFSCSTLNELWVSTLNSSTPGVSCFCLCVVNYRRLGRWRPVGAGLNLAGAGRRCRNRIGRQFCPLLSLGVGTCGRLAFTSCFLPRSAQVNGLLPAAATCCCRRTFCGCRKRSRTRTWRLGLPNRAGAARGGITRGPRGCLEFPLLAATFDGWARDAPLWPDNPASFRRRWDDMKAIGVPVSGALGLTPGSLRGGGAVALFETTGDLALVQGRLRLETSKLCATTCRRSWRSRCGCSSRTRPSSWWCAPPARPRACSRPRSAGSSLRRPLCFRTPRVVASVVDLFGLG